MHHLLNVSWPRVEGVVSPFFSGEPVGRRHRTTCAKHLELLDFRLGARELGCIHTTLDIGRVLLMTSFSSPEGLRKGRCCSGRGGVLGSCCFFGFRLRDLQLCGTIVCLRRSRHGPWSEGAGIQVSVCSLFSGPHEHLSAQCKYMVRTDPASGSRDDSLHLAPWILQAYRSSFNPVFIERCPIYCFPFACSSAWTIQHNSGVFSPQYAGSFMPGRQRFRV